MSGRLLGIGQQGADCPGDHWSSPRRSAPRVSGGRRDARLHLLGQTFCSATIHSTRRHKNSPGGGLPREFIAPQHRTSSLSAE
eukprot:4533714-Prymnesium_polylepis.2